MGVLLQLFVNLPWNLLIQLSIMIITLEVILFIKGRLRLHKTFDRGNLPSIGNKNIFSGNVYEVLARPDNMEIVDKYHRKLGKTYGLIYGADTWAMSIDLDLLQKVFITDSKKSIDITPLRTPFVTELDRALVQLQGDDWRHIRKILNPSFTHKQMKSDNVYRDIEESCDSLLKCIEGHPKKGSKGERIIDVAYNCKKYSMDIIFKVAFGHRNGINFKPGAKDDVIEVCLEGERAAASTIAWLSVLFHKLQRPFGWMINHSQLGVSIRYIHDLLSKSLEQRREVMAKRQRDSNIKDKSTNGFARMMVDTLVEDMEANNIDEETLKANLFFIFAAGFETTANTLSILFYYLAHNQNIQEKLREAIKNEGENARYIEWCAQEVLRLYPAVCATGRVASEDIVTSSGQTIFKGTVVLASVVSIGRCEEYWGPDVAEFRPERFGADNLHPVQFFAFGHGPRTCIGRNLAMAELRALVTRILLKYKIETCESTPKKINWISPNMIHMIVEHPINLKFIELSNL